MKFQPVKAMGIRHWSILGAASILSSLGMFAPPAWAQARQIDFDASSRSNQTAQTKQIDFTLSSHSNQTYAALIQQAEFLAASFIEQGFTESPGITEISVSILGERHGQQAPLLFSRVSRSDWQRQPRIQEWTKYFDSSAVLLGFQKPQLQQTASSPSTGTSVEQTTSSPPPATFIQQTNSSPSAGTSVEQTNSSPSAGTSVEQTNSSPSPDTSRNGASREERESGFR